MKKQELRVIHSQRIRNADIQDEVRDPEKKHQYNADRPDLQFVEYDPFPGILKDEQPHQGGTDDQAGKML